MWYDKRTKIFKTFFIKREERRKHYGKIAFEKLLEKIGINKIEIDVLQRNEIGLKFWQNIGFKEQWIRMKFGEENVIKKKIRIL